MSALDRPSNPERRAALGKLALLLAVMPVGWGSWKLAQSQQWTADYRTAVGERREWTLADGSRITLNTNTAVDVLFDSQQRLIRLREGEILVQTATDNSPLARPFLVSTAQGHMQALGTRFIVRQFEPVHPPCGIGRRRQSGAGREPPGRVPDRQCRTTHGIHRTGLWRGEPH